MKAYNFYKSLWTIKYFSKGKLLWEDVAYNNLVQGGEETLLECFFRAQPTFTPANFYVRLCNDNILLTDTLLDVSGEPLGESGYTPQVIERSAVGFPTKGLNQNGNYQLSSKVVTFTANGGSIGPVTTAYLATTSDNSGILLAYRPLALTRTILDGDSMTIQFVIALE